MDKPNGTIAQSVLDFGLVVDDVREAVWMGDAAIDWEGTPVPDRERWRREGARAGILRVREGQTPTVFRYRPLTAIERSAVEDRSLRILKDTVHVDVSTRFLLSTAVGLDLPSLPASWDRKNAQGEVVGKVFKHVDDDGLTRLSDAVLDRLGMLPGFGAEFFMFFGMRIWAGSSATREDFLASSPASTGASSPSGAKGGASSATAAPRRNRRGSTAPTEASETPPRKAGA